MRRKTNMEKLCLLQYLICINVNYMWQKLQFIALADKPFCSLDGMTVLVTEADCVDLKRKCDFT